MRIKFSKEVFEFLNTQSVITDNNGDKYFYMPHWLKQSKDNPLTFEMLGWDHLPQELKDALRKERERIDPPRPGIFNINNPND